jgi:DNA-binding transcriptional regulator YiaG
MSTCPITRGRSTRSAIPEVPVGGAQQSQARSPHGGAGGGPARHAGGCQGARGCDAGRAVLGVRSGSRTKFSELRKELEARPGAKERLAAKRAETLEEIRLYELRHAEAVSQAELAGRLEVTQGAISKLEHSDDVRVSTLRQYLEALGARLELVAVFDDDGDRRVPIHLGKEPAA